MRRLFGCGILGAALLLSACGAAQVQQGANQAATAISAPEVGTEVSNAVGQVATAISGPEAASAISEAANQVGTAMSAPEVGTALAAPEVGTAMSEAGTAVSGALGSLSAVEPNVALQQGTQLVLDATKSVGNITDYKWTIQKAPAGAESVVGQTIKEGSSGNVSLSPDDYAKYFPKSGSYTVRLTVTDATGASSDTDFTVDVP